MTTVALQCAKNRNPVWRYSTLIFIIITTRGRIDTRHAAKSALQTWQHIHACAGSNPANHTKIQTNFCSASSQSSFVCNAHYSLETSSHICSFYIHSHIAGIIQCTLGSFAQRLLHFTVAIPFSSPFIQKWQNSCMLSCLYIHVFYFLFL